MILARLMAITVTTLDFHKKIFFENFPGFARSLLYEAGT
jgi:hypothetical protein